MHHYGLIVLEDLSLNFMLRNEHLALSAHDAGLGLFRSHFQRLGVNHAPLKPLPLDRRVQVQ